MPAFPSTIDRRKRDAHDMTRRLDFPALMRDDDAMTITSTHRELAHRAIDYDIDNILDELHDRALDDYADMIEPHLDALRALAYARHDIACSDMTTTAHDDDDDPAFDMMNSDTPAPCLRESESAISALAYSYYRD